MLLVSDMVMSLILIAFLFACDMSLCSGVSSGMSAGAAYPASVTCSRVSFGMSADIDFAVASVSSRVSPGICWRRPH